MQQVSVKGIGRVDAITKGKIVDMKNYNWSKYSSYKSVISSFKEQGMRYRQLIGATINGQKINSVEFFFSSKPPNQVIDALKGIGVKVNWIK